MSRLNYINLVPQEILTNIFTRLPAKSLGLCKCVSKSWDSLISDPYFIKAHVTETSVNNIILISSYSNLMHTVRFDNDNLCEKTASKLRFSCCDNWSKVWGSCDGLVLVEDAWRTMYLLNPTTFESKKLPALRGRFRSHTIRNLYGFGYDSSCDDYAVVFMCYQPGLKKEFCVYVYMLRKNLWKKIGYSPYDHKVDSLRPVRYSLSPGIFFKGSLHWLAKNYNRRRKRFISVFNIATQKFSKVSPPKGIHRPDLSYSKLEVHEGCLRLTALVANVHMTVEMWVMKEYGVVESWTKLSVVLSMNYDIVPLDFPDDSLVVWDGYEHQLDLHVLNSKEVIKIFDWHVSNSKEAIKVLGLPSCGYRVGMTFRDSLVSPNNKKNGSRRQKTAED